MAPTLPKMPNRPGYWYYLVEGAKPQLIKVVADPLIGNLSIETTSIKDGAFGVDREAYDPEVWGLGGWIYTDLQDFKE